MNRTNSKYSKVLLIFVSICLVFSFLFFSLFFAFGCWLLSGDELDPEFAVFVADDDLVTKRYDFESCSKISFFDDWEYLTKFVNAYPKLQIVNDTQYYAEVTTNEKLHDILKFSKNDNKSMDKWLFIGIQEEYYNRVHENDIDYDYDYGLYVDCSVFEIVIHAPICAVYSNTKTDLDFDVAKSGDVSVCLNGGCGAGSIYNIDANRFYLECHHNSNVKVAGKVNGVASLILFHDSYVDIQELVAKENKTDIRADGTVVAKDWTKEENSHFYEIVLLVVLAIVGQFLFWLIWEIKLIKRQIRKKQSQDN